MTQAIVVVVVVPDNTPSRSLTRDESCKVQQDVCNYALFEAKRALVELKDKVSAFSIELALFYSTNLGGPDPRPVKK